jgi:hypothetical protein
MPIPIKSALGPLQTAVGVLLLANTALTTKLAQMVAGTAYTGIYDQVPESAPFPYITIGPDREKKWLTQGRLGREADLEFEIWSRYQGFKEADAILDLLVAALDHAALTVTGFARAEVVLDAVGPRTREPDGLTRHISVYFSVHLEQT